MKINNGDSYLLPHSAEALTNFGFAIDLHAILTEKRRKKKSRKMELSAIDTLRVMLILLQLFYNLPL